MHDVVIVSIPLVAILAGILFNRSDFTKLRDELRSEISGLRTEIKGEIRELRTEMKSRFDVVDAELRYFHGTIGKLEARVEALEKQS